MISVRNLNPASLNLEIIKSVSMIDLVSRIYVKG